VLVLTKQKKYFVLHAPRQTGKTTCVLALQEYLNKEGKYRALYINVESAQGAREDVYRAIQFIIYKVAYRYQKTFKDDYFLKHYKELLEQTGEYSAFKALLSTMSEYKLGGEDI